jgi:hypothetical protein
LLFSSGGLRSTHATVPYRVWRGAQQNLILRRQDEYKYRPVKKKRGAVCGQSKSRLPTLSSVSDPNLSANPGIFAASAE